MPRCGEPGHPGSRGAKTDDAGQQRAALPQFFRPHDGGAMVIITAKFMIPRVIWMSIRAQQHAAQNAPWRKPKLKAPCSPGLHCWLRYNTGSRQCLRQACFVAHGAISNFGDTSRFWIPAQR